MYSICAFSKRTTNTALSSVEHSLDTRSALLRPHTPTPNSFFQAIYRILRCLATLIFTVLTLILET